MDQDAAGAQPLEGVVVGVTAPRRADEPVRVGTVALRLGVRTVVIGDAVVELAPREREVLEILALRPGAVVCKSQLLQQVWHGDADEHAVEVTIGRLRRRLSGALGIQTVPRRGYRLVAPG